MISVSEDEFSDWVAEAVDALPEETLAKLHNVAFLVADEPSAEQRHKIDLRGRVLYGLYEGSWQSRRLNVGASLPDRITIFRHGIATNASSAEEAKKQIASTLRHEIAHCFGSDEKGAQMAAVQNENV